MLLLLALACGDPEPVMQAVPPNPAAPSAAERRAANELRASPANVEAVYRRAEGVYVDARYLGGRRYDAVRADVEEQLGALVEEREPVGLVRELVFERGSLRLRDGVIQMVEVPLPDALRRSEALARLGFPPATGEYASFALEFRLLNAWGFRRIRFFREARGSEEITRIEAWKFSDPN